MKLFLSTIFLIPTLFAQTNLDSKEAMLKALKQRRADVYKWMLLCDGKYKGQASQFPNECKQIDMLEFAGAACLSAQLAGDEYIVKERCRDVSLGQAKNGRWWRGESNIEKQNENSFSRDMMSGLINYFLSQGYYSKDPTAREKARTQAMNWIEWIEREGKGKKMCNDDKGFFNNRCSIKGNNVLYYAFKTIGAITDKNKRYKTIRKLSRRKGLNGWEIETFFTPPGYQMLLKSHKLYQKYLMGMLDKRQYRVIAEIIYKKNPRNAWHQFMYLGPTKHTVERTLKLCPKERPKRSDWTINHYTPGDFMWQRDTDDRAWEVADGHDCIALINWEIAALEGKVELPFKEAADSCGNRPRLGEFNGKEVCEAWTLNVSRIKCTNKNGIAQDFNGKEYCLTDIGKYFQAVKLVRECPYGHRLVGEFRGDPLCEPTHAPDIALFRCIRGGAGDMHGPANQVIEEAGEFKHCHLYKETWFQKKRIGRYCPVGTKFQHEFIWNKWPVCKGLLRVRKSKCKAPKHIPREGHCLYRMKGWFSKRKYK